MGLLPLLALIAAGATPEAAPSTMPGVWSFGEVRNCATGTAWVFTADGWYAEIKLPSGPATAVGLWHDEGNALVYTHAHSPYPGRDKPMERGRYSIQERTAEKISARNATGQPRYFHRCAPEEIGPPTED